MTENLSSDAIAQLHGPVGLGIGTKTPAEIAIWIAAEIVQEKNRVGMDTKTQENIASTCAVL